MAGLQAWAADVNSLGGIRLGCGPSSPPWPVEIEFLDDGSSINGVRRSTERLIVVNQVHLLFGPYSSVLTTAAAAVAEEHGRLLWNQGGASGEVYRRGYRGIVGILTPADKYLTGLLPMVREAGREATTVGILRSSKGAFSKEVTSVVQALPRSDLAEGAAQQLGFRLQFLWEFDPGGPDYDALASAAAAEAPDVLVAAGRIGNDLALAKRLAEHRRAFKTVAVVAAPIDQFRRDLGEKADGFVGPSQWEPQAKYLNDFGPGAEAVLESLTRRSGLPVDYPMVQAYAAGLVAQRCIEAAGSLDEAGLRETAAGLDFSTFYGRFKIDPETGCQVGREVVLAQWQAGSKALVWPPEQRENPLLYPWR